MPKIHTSDFSDFDGIYRFGRIDTANGFDSVMRYSAREGAVLYHPRFTE